MVVNTSKLLHRFRVRRHVSGSQGVSGTEASASAAPADGADWNGFTFGLHVPAPVNVAPSNERK